MTGPTAKPKRTPRAYLLDKHTAANGVVLEHRNGWMNKSQVARALGYKNSRSVDSLPLTAVEVPRKHKNAQLVLEPLCRYRLHDVCEFMTRYQVKR
ncbi:MAG: hypothetical protein WAQ53_13565 [Thiofilum sp.]|uniref:hypothetical protein n=1 Tax=Thiofilum sp. TaxID=2212733 RepID=UPI0025FDAD91|nr:hypothetical protein [Thiofilum sp.]MBK8453615.1 hypothetical protein [Thiofilum sp.]